MMGDSSVGKTSLCYRLCQNIWAGDTSPTVAAAFHTLTTMEQHGKEIQVWDTAGAERYKALNSIYYRNANGAMIVFDITNPNSFKTLDEWFQEFSIYAAPNPVIVVVGNKSDLMNPDLHKPLLEEAEKWAGERNFDFILASAQSGEGTEDIRKVFLDKIPFTKYIVPDSVSVTQQHDDENASSDKKCC